MARVLYIKEGVFRQMQEFKHSVYTTTSNGSSSTLWFLGCPFTLLLSIPSFPVSPCNLPSAKPPANYSSKCTPSSPQPQAPHCSFQPCSHTTKAHGISQTSALVLPLGQGRVHSIALGQNSTSIGSSKPDRCSDARIYFIFVCSLQTCKAAESEALASLP